MRAVEDRGLPRAAKAALLAAVLVGLLALVSLASRGGHPGTGGRFVKREVPASVSNDFLTIIILAYVLGVLSLVVVAYHHRRRWKAPPRRSRWLRDFAVIAFVMLFVALIGQRTIEHSRLRAQAAKQRQQQVTAGKGRNRPVTLSDQSETTKPAHFNTGLALTIVGLLLAGGVVYLVRYRRRLALEAGAEDAIAEELSAVVEETIDDLRGEADPRRAVIAAYARMERVLGSHGHPRRPAEAPFEYLGRILLELRVRAGAVRQLTELFERAKFSTHEIDRAMKETAISALLSVRDDLRATTA